jgi:hypothetical protein
MNTTTHKAWVAGVAAAVIPILGQNLTGTSKSVRVIYDSIICHLLGSACPVPDAVADSLWVVLSGVISGVVVGGLTWLVKNLPKSDTSIVPKI